MSQLEEEEHSNIKQPLAWDEALIECHGMATKRKRIPGSFSTVVGKTEIVSTFRLLPARKASVEARKESTSVTKQHGFSN